MKGRRLPLSIVEAHWNDRSRRSQKKLQLIGEYVRKEDVRGDFGMIIQSRLWTDASKNSARLGSRRLDRVRTGGVFKALIHCQVNEQQSRG